MNDARLVAVNVLFVLRQGAGRTTAIDKRPVDGPVEVGELGLVGDVQCDTRYHGGPDKALYAYSTEDAVWWAEELDRDVAPGLFGENLTVEGLDVSEAEIGERWRIGSDVVVEVRQPRTPCDNLSLRMGIPGFHRQFRASGRVGAYLSVLQTGTVTATDPITVIHRLGHGVTIAAWSARRTPEHAEQLLSSGIDLAPPLRASARRLTRRTR